MQESAILAAAFDRRRSGGMSTGTTNDMVPPLGGPPRWPGRLQDVRRLGILLPFLVLFIYLSFASSAFATKVNMLNILDQQSATLIIAAAGTLVLVSGGIDLRLGRPIRSPASRQRILRNT